VQPNPPAVGANAPEALQGYFGDSYPKLNQFATLLVDLGIPRGFVGPREGDRIWDRHILNCAALDQVLPESGAILDLGSGAGLPGIVVAILRPQQQIVLLESLLRRTTWLTEVADTLELTNVKVIRGRAGENLKLPPVAAVTARAVASLSKLLSWSAPILTRCGALYAIKGEGVNTEIAELSSAPGSKKLNREWLLPPVVSELYTLPDLGPTTVVKVERR